MRRSTLMLFAIMCVKNEEYYLPGFLKSIEMYGNNALEPKGANRTFA